LAKRNGAPLPRVQIGNNDGVVIKTNRERMSKAMKAAG
jgi:hypothetical protein